jgi:hypothetical protein
MRTGLPEQALVGGVAPQQVVQQLQAVLHHHPAASVALLADDGEDAAT